MVGQQIEHYRVLQHLGDGGMGTVFRALDTMLEREVALKILRTDLSDQPEVTRRFRAEAVTLARLSHPNIATLFGLVRHGAQLGMVMELVPGDTLSTLMQREGVFGWERAARLTVQILTALDYAHASGIIHRDIKPSNVIVSATGVVKVLDFGIARVLDADRMTRQGLIIGTPQYMAPEQIRAADLDGRADVYSVGVLLYEMLAGRLPFRAENDIALMYAHLEGRITPLVECAPATPTWLFEVVDRALAKSPESRFASAAMFRDALDAELPHRPSGVRHSIVTAAPSEVLTVLETPTSNPAPPSRASVAARPPTPRTGGLIALFRRVRAWVWPRVTWEYQAGPDGMLTVRRAFRPRSGPHVQPPTPTVAPALASSWDDSPAIDPSWGPIAPDAAPAGESRARWGIWPVLAAAVVAAGIGVGIALRRAPDDAGRGGAPTTPPSSTAPSPVAATASPSPPPPPAPGPSPLAVSGGVAPVEAGAVPPRPGAPARVAGASSPAVVAPPGAGTMSVDARVVGSASAATGSAPAPAPPLAGPASPSPALPPVPPAAVPTANLRDEAFEELVLLVPVRNGGYDDVEVTLTFARDHLVVFDTDEERVVATILYAGDKTAGPTVSGPATWLSGSEQWFLIPTTSGRLVLRTDEETAARVVSAFESRTGRRVTRARGELGG
jgi:serine/threonine-protein kinase